MLKAEGRRKKNNSTFFSCQLPISECQFPITNCQLPIASHRFPNRKSKIKKLKSSCVSEKFANFQNFQGYFYSPPIPQKFGSVCFWFGCDKLQLAASKYSSPLTRCERSTFHLHLGRIYGSSFARLLYKKNRHSPSRRRL